MQCLHGCLAALGRFMKKFGDKSLPFFHVLRTNRKCDSTSGCEEAFDTLNHHLKMLPLLDKLVARDTLYLYFSVGEVAINSVLVILVNFVSKVPIFPRTYCHLKYLYVLIVSARTLHPYFHAHIVTILTNQALKHFLQTHRRLRRNGEKGRRPK